MSTLVALSDSEKSHSISLTESQISGNRFLFTAAGYDTTADTLAYGTTIVASQPQWQSWIYHENSPRTQPLRLRVLLSPTC